VAKQAEENWGTVSMLNRETKIHRKCSRELEPWWQTWNLTSREGDHAVGTEVGENPAIGIRTVVPNEPQDTIENLKQKLVPGRA
jgi:hypothetical protein